MDKLINHWDYFDKMYCISLDERPDRREEAEAQFAKAGLSERVEFHVVRKHPHDSEQGIYESHIECMKKGISAGAGNIVIFEDDILFDGFSQQRLERCVDFMRGASDWKAFFFGCLVAGSRRTRHEGVLAVKYRASTHAYVLNRGFAQLLTQQPWRRIAYDVELRSHEGGFYAIYPSFAFQSNSPSENNKLPRLDKIRRLLGGLRRIQKRNEFYHHHRTAVVGLHIIVILLIVLWFLPR